MFSFVDEKEKISRSFKKYLRLFLELRWTYTFLLAITITMNGPSVNRV